MSHIVSIEVKINDLPALQLAVAHMGFEWLEGQKTYEWYGQWIGDSPMPDTMTKEELGTCDHAIRVPGCKYEVGVVAMPDGTFELRYDYYYSGGLEPVLGQVAAPLVQEYAAQRTIAAAALLGRGLMHRFTKEDGSIEIVLAGGV